MISADLAKLEAFGTDYLFMLLEARMREVSFRSYIADALGTIAGLQKRWADIAYPVCSNQDTPAETRSASEIADEIIAGLSAALEVKDT